MSYCLVNTAQSFNIQEHKRNTLCFMQIAGKNIDSELQWTAGTEICRDGPPTTWAPEDHVLIPTH